MPFDVDLFQSAMGALLGVVGSFFVLRRRYSHDTVEIEKNKQEASLLATLRAERDAAMRDKDHAWQQRMEDVIKIAKLEAQLEMQTLETKTLRDEIFAMRLHTRKLTAIIVRLDPEKAEMLDLHVDHDGIEAHPKLPTPKV